MTLDEIRAELELENLTPELPLTQVQVRGGYVCDLLSDVLAHAPAGGLLVTVQLHLNVVAVAVHADLAGVIFAGDRRPGEQVRMKAVQEKVPLLCSRLSAFEIAGRLWQLGLGGPGR